MENYFCFVYFILYYMLFIGYYAQYFICRTAVGHAASRQESPAPSI